MKALITISLALMTSFSPAFAAETARFQCTTLEQENGQYVSFIFSVGNWATDNMYLQGIDEETSNQILTIPEVTSARFLIDTADCGIFLSETKFELCGEADGVEGATLTLWASSNYQMGTLDTYFDGDGSNTTWETRVICTNHVYTY